VPYRGPVSKVIDSLMDGVRSGYSYAGAQNLHDLQESAEWLELSVHGFKESLPHGK
jgi:IMP dehydrogenase